MAPFDFGRFDALTFDCYGTLIDWETGIARALRIAFQGQAGDVDDEELLTIYARHEAAAEAGPYMPYRAILARTAQDVASDMGASIGTDAADTFGNSVGQWPAFS